VIGVYEAHEAVVDLRELVVVESGGEVGGFGEGEGFVAEDGEGSIDYQHTEKKLIKVIKYLSVT
jgi:hypothetical protein